ncbi:MAG: biotin transporter BioY [Rhodovibrionaceae bacterium]
MAISTAASNAVHPTLISAIWPEEEPSRVARNVVLAILGAALLTIAAKVQLPLYPVPMTMQSFVVLVLAMAFGWRLGGATVLLYLAEGAVGLPVFASGSGLAYLGGTSGGYLVGYLVAALALGWLAEKGWDRSPLLSLLALTLGSAIILALGTAWLTVLIGYSEALAGFAPLLIGAAVKLALAMAAILFAWHRVARSRETG